MVVPLWTKNEKNLFFSFPKFSHTCWHPELRGGGVNIKNRQLRPPTGVTNDIPTPSCKSFIYFHTKSFTYVSIVPNHLKGTNWGSRHNILLRLVALMICIRLKKTAFFYQVQQTVKLITMGGLSFCYVLCNDIPMHASTGKAAGDAKLCLNI